MCTFPFVTFGCAKPYCMFGFLNSNPAKWNDFYELEMVGIRTLLVGGIQNTYYNFVEFPRHHKPAVFLMSTWVPCRRTLYSLLGCTKKGKFLIRYTMSKGALYPGHFPATQGWVFTPPFFKCPTFNIMLHNFRIGKYRSFLLKVIPTPCGAYF